ncbi:MAG: RNA methyltransferase [Ardenticatenaceae bacterium]|nr:RNA methyltransferase [Ardenticatenaceae bacterium]
MASDTIITSFSNPLVKRVKRLRQKKYRLQEGVFFVEGLRGVLTAVETHAPIETLITCPELLASPVAQAMLAQTSLPQVALSRPVFESISERENPVGLAAIIKTGWTQLNELVVRPDSIFVALFDASDPGNLGTIVRTMDAVGAAGLVLVGQGVDPFHGTAVKASMGTLFTVPIGHTPDADSLFQWAQQQQIQTIATSARGTADFQHAPYHLPALLLLGSEREGLPAAILAQADLQVAIPMHGTASSLNVAVSAGILLYTLRHRWQ